MTIVGDLLRELRGNKSLREVERGSGISNTYLSSIEKGVDPRSGNEIKPSPDVLRKLANYYGHPYHDLMIKAGYLTLTENERANDLIISALENPNNIFTRTPTGYHFHLKEIDLEENISKSQIYKGRKLNKSEIVKILNMVKVLLEEEQQNK